MAEQHLQIANARPGYIGSIATALDVADAVEFAGQRAVQVGGADAARIGAPWGGGVLRHCARRACSPMDSRIARASSTLKRTAAGHFTVMSMAAQ
jgi:hypothetical protein